MSSLDNLLQSLTDIPAMERLGEIEKFTGLIIEANGPAGAFVGEICDILTPDNRVLMQAQVLGFEKNKVFLMPFGHIQGISQGCQIKARAHSLSVPVGGAMLGRVVNAFGQAIDRKPPLNCHQQAPLQSPGINPLQRQEIREILKTGIHCIDSLLTLGIGQRVGLFAGSGVGKSMLLGMIAQNLQADINIIALIGERGREVQEFISQNLGMEALARTIVVVATADEPALMRKQAVYTATALAEHFCRQGKKVALMLDSITRFAMAQREISLALGEPPTARGYTPSVFSILPGLIERAGNFSGQGSISAFYTVLVEGDDFNEPIADTMRSLLDGHIVLTRKLAQSGHYPAIDLLQSISRLATRVIDSADDKLVKKVIKTLHCYETARDMLEVGAYQSGSNPALDKAISRMDRLNALLCQQFDETRDRDTVMTDLRQIMEDGDVD